MKYVHQVRSDMGSIGDLKKNPARELVKTAGIAVHGVPAPLESAIPYLDEKRFSLRRAHLRRAWTASRALAADTAEAAALAYARHVGIERAAREATEARDEGPQPLTAEQARAAAEREGLALVPANNASGFKGVALDGVVDGRRVVRNNVRVRAKPTRHVVVRRRRRRLLRGRRAALPLLRLCQPPALPGRDRARLVRRRPLRALRRAAPPPSAPLAAP